MSKGFIEDDFCDYLDPSKICDNCGACLNMSKSDLQAIKIEEIAKNVEENKVVEEDLTDSDFFEDTHEIPEIPNWDVLIAKAQKLDQTMDKKEIEKALVAAYSNIAGEDFESHLKDPVYSLDETYSVEDGDDVFSREVVYLDDIDLDDALMEEDTEELFPGFRKLKRK